MRAKEEPIIMNHIPENEHSQLLSNSIRTPDGTVISSHSRHDYVTHTDANGLTYMVDGGTAYLRRTVHKDAPYEELSVYMTEDHEHNREHFRWGGRGPKGDQPLRWILLKDMELGHIEAVLATQPQIRGGYIEDLMRAELAYRSKGGEIEFEYDLGGGKYTYRRLKGGGQKCLRYGEQWRDLTGDSMVYAMMARLEELNNILIEHGLYLDE